MTRPKKSKTPASSQQTERENTITIDTGSDDDFIDTPAPKRQKKSQLNRRSTDTTRRTRATEPYQSTEYFAAPKHRPTDKMAYYLMSDLFAKGQNGRMWQSDDGHLIGSADWLKEIFARDDVWNKIAPLSATKNRLMMTVKVDTGQMYHPLAKLKDVEIGLAKVAKKPRAPVKEPVREEESDDEEDKAFMRDIDGQQPLSAYQSQRDAAMDEDDSEDDGRELPIFTQPVRLTRNSSDTILKARPRGGTDEIIAEAAGDNSESRALEDGNMAHIDTRNLRREAKSRKAKEYADALTQPTNDETVQIDTLSDLPSQPTDEINEEEVEHGSHISINSSITDEHTTGTSELPTIKNEPANQPINVATNPYDIPAATPGDTIEAVSDTNITATITRGTTSLTNSGSRSPDTWMAVGGEKSLVPKQAPVKQETVNGGTRVKTEVDGNNSGTSETHDQTSAQGHVETLDRDVVKSEPRVESTESRDNTVTNDRDSMAVQEMSARHGSATKHVDPDRIREIFSSAKALDKSHEDSAEEQEESIRTG